MKPPNTAKAIATNMKKANGVFYMNEKRFERIYADVDVFCRDHNAKGLSQLIEREDYDKIVDLLNKQEETIQSLNKENSKLLQANLKLTNENTIILQNIRQAYQNERTSLGRNVLKQLLDMIE